MVGFNYKIIDSYVVDCISRCCCNNSHYHNCSCCFFIKKWSRRLWRWWRHSSRRRWTHSFKDYYRGLNDDELNPSQIKVVYQMLFLWWQHQKKWQGIEKKLGESLKGGSFFFVFRYFHWKEMWKCYIICENPKLNLGNSKVELWKLSSEVWLWLKDILKV